MQLGPVLSIWLNVAYIIATTATASVLQQMGVANFQAVAAYAGFIAVILNGVMHAFSSSVPGPLAPPDSPLIKAATDGASPQVVLHMAQRVVDKQVLNDSLNKA